MGKVICNGALLNYRTVGEGEDIVLIHGLAANHAFWHMKVLLSLVRDFRVTVYDLRGHGHSDMPAEGYTSLNLACDLNELLNHLEIKQAHLIGHSLGGLVSLQYARLHPERVRTLTIADSRIRSLQPTNFIKDWPNSQTIVEKLHKLERLLRRIYFIEENLPTVGDITEEQFKKHLENLKKCKEPKS